MSLADAAAALNAARGAAGVATGSEIDMLEGEKQEKTAGGGEKSKRGRPAGSKNANKTLRTGVLHATSRKICMHTTHTSHTPICMHVNGYKRIFLGANIRPMSIHDMKWHLRPRLFTLLFRRHVWFSVSDDMSRHRRSVGRDACGRMLGPRFGPGCGL